MKMLVGKLYMVKFFPHVYSLQSFLKVSLITFMSQLTSVSILPGSFELNLKKLQLVGSFLVCVVFFTFFLFSVVGVFCRLCLIFQLA